MIPQAQQIDRIAEALGVSSFAITGFENNISLKTEGDFMGLMIMLIKSNIVCIKGERDENSLYNIETVSFEINPLITKFFNANIEDKQFSAKEILYTLKRKNLLQDLLAWEKINYGYEKCAAKYNDTPNKATQKALEELKNNKEKIEMELQCSNVLLTTDGHIAVRILPPNFFD